MELTISLCVVLITLAHGLQALQSYRLQREQISLNVALRRLNEELICRPTRGIYIKGCKESSWSRHLRRGEMPQIRLSPEWSKRNGEIDDAQTLHIDLN